MFYVFHLEFKICVNAQPWLYSPSVQRTIQKLYDNNKDFRIKTRVVYQNTLENWQRVKNISSVYKVGSTKKDEQNYVMYEVFEFLHFIDVLQVLRLKSCK
jgi:hypothetical protein